MENNTNRITGNTNDTEIYYKSPEAVVCRGLMRYGVPAEKLLEDVLNILQAHKTKLNSLTTANAELEGGYTCDIREAEMFPVEEAERIARSDRPGKYTVHLCSDIESNKEAQKLIIDCQYISK